MTVAVLTAVSLCLNLAFLWKKPLLAVAAGLLFAGGLWLNNRIS